RPPSRGAVRPSEAASPPSVGASGASTASPNCKKPSPARSRTTGVTRGSGEKASCGDASTAPSAPSSTAATAFLRGARLGLIGSSPATSTGCTSAASTTSGASAATSALLRRGARLAGSTGSATTASTPEASASLVTGSVTGFLRGARLGLEGSAAASAGASLAPACTSRSGECLGSCIGRLSEVMSGRGKRGTGRVGGFRGTEGLCSPWQPGLEFKKVRLGNRRRCGVIGNVGSAGVGERRARLVGTGGDQVGLHFQQGFLGPVERIQSHVGGRQGGDHVFQAGQQTLRAWQIIQRRQVR